ncbi:hypothetical protein [Staphylococcus hominis]
MSGIIPSNGDLLPHLENRLECECILHSCGTSINTLRASLIISVKISSYSILKILTEKLSILSLPYWSKNLIAPFILEM